MKTMFLNPSFERKGKLLNLYSRQSRSPCVTNGGTFYHPYYLAYGAGWTEHNGFKTWLIDAVASEWSHNFTVEQCRKYFTDGKGLIVMDTSTPSILNDIRQAAKIKAVLPGVHIAVMGIHPSNVPEETLVHGKGAIDSVIRWEVDETALELAQHLEAGKKLDDVKGLVFREGEKFVHTPQRPLIQDLDKLPFVSETYFKHLGEEGMKKYFYASLTWPEVTILSGRGCLYSCSFCHIPFKSSYRFRSPNNVADEFEYIKNELPFISEIQLEDDTYPLNKQRTLEMCREIVRRGIKIKWSCNARVNTDYDTLKSMKDAGCRLLCVGFESPEQEELNSVKKGTTAKMQEEFMDSVKKIGLITNGCFILGLPEDNSKRMQSTIDFAKKLMPDTAQFFPLMAYPGTSTFKWATEKGFLTTTDYDQWVDDEGKHNTLISRPDLSNKELVEWADIALKQYYSSPKYIAYKAVQSIKSPSEAVRTAKSAAIFFKRLAQIHGLKKEWQKQPGVESKQIEQEL